MSESDAHHIPVRWLVRHKLRALKMRICFCLGLPSLVPEVPECDGAGLARLRYALSGSQRGQGRRIGAGLCGAPEPNAALSPGNSCPMCHQLHIIRDSA